MGVKGKCCRASGSVGKLDIRRMLWDYDAASFWNQTSGVVIGGVDDEATKIKQNSKHA